MHLISYSAAGWESWGLAHQPLIRDRMPILIDDDLRFEDPGGVPRPTMVVNRWLRSLPLNGAPAVRTWEIDARSLCDWLLFLQRHGVEPLGDRDRLRDALSMYAGHRLAGDLEHRWDTTTWNLHMGVLSGFYRWAQEEGYAQTVPFTYKAGRRMADGVLVAVEHNMAKLRSPRPHTSVKHLERDFAQLFVRALAGLLPDGEADTRFRGREGARNAAMAGLVLASGLRRQEFTCLTVHEIPLLPARRTQVPVLFPLAAATTKGQKARTTWTSYDALAAVHQYMELDRAASAEGFVWRPPPKLGGPLVVEAPDWEGATIDGVRRPWRKVTSSERLRLVSPEGQSPLLGLQSNGKPFVDWATVFRRTSARIRERFEPRFPTVAPHRLRHSFAMHTLEWLVTGYYRQAAALVKETGGDAAMALYLTRSDPMLVLRDLLGHQSVVSTQLYIARLDVQRIYRDASNATSAYADLGDDPTVAAELAAEFDEERGD